MRERDIGAGERERMGEEGEEERHEREMCVRASVQERLSCTINQRFFEPAIRQMACGPKANKMTTVLSCRNLFLIRL